MLVEQDRHHPLKYRSAEGHFERQPALVAELMKLPAMALVARNTPGVHAARAATTIPMVLAVDAGLKLIGKGR